MNLKVDSIRECLEGAIPGTMATTAPNGTPNIAYLSQVQFVDADHVALSYQFFNKTRQNILANPIASLKVGNPTTGAHYLLALQYLRTETTGPLFESMKAKLAGIASHTGMSGVFKLLGADVFRVLAVEAVPIATLQPAPTRRNMLAATRKAIERLDGCADLESVLNRLLDVLEHDFGITHAMVLMLDHARGALYTVTSRGYDASGAGSEIPLGQGVIGVAARERTPIRIGHMTSEYAYGRAIRESVQRNDPALALETEIPLPGLAQSRSQLAVPILACGQTLGVIFVESDQDLRFTYDDEDALVTVAGHLGLAIRLMQNAPEATEPSEWEHLDTSDTRAAPVARPLAKGPELAVRRYPANNSIFLDGNYLIKGVAGAIFWSLVSDYVHSGRHEFSNRELRLDSRIRLPDFSDNLEARLVLLGKRLSERNAGIRIEKTGRGRFRLEVEHPLQLTETPD